MGNDVCRDAVRVMVGLCVGYNPCYTAERNSRFVGDVTVSCRKKAGVCGYAAACGERFSNASSSCLTF